jgi:hypothetical protein
VAFPASKNKRVKFKGVAKFLLFSFGLLIFLIHLWISTEEEAKDDVAEQSKTCIDLIADDSVKMKFTHNRGWVEYQNNTDFCSQYDVSFNEVEEAEFNRNNINIENWTDDPDYWRQVYSTLYLDNRDHLQAIQDSLLIIKGQRNLDRDEFATMVVAFVQDIPYEYVLQEECAGTEVSPCNGNVMLGLYSPVEFLGRMHGDCDTRTVLLYTLLRNFGYEPLIVNSKEYLHSTLALDVASSGDDFEYKGRQYAYWETTNVGWLAGMLPPDMNNKDYWSVALDYEF